MKIKIFFFSLITLAFYCSGYSQYTNQIEVYHGISNSDFVRNEEIAGAGSFDIQDSREIGIRYLRNISPKWSIGGGLNVINADVEVSPAYTGIPTENYYEEFEMISVPLYASYKVGNYFFANAGPIIDFQNSDGSYDSQSGIGYQIGIAGEFGFNRFFVYAHPNYKKHAFLPFHKENYHQKLMEFSLQAGLGYKF